MKAWKKRSPEELSARVFSALGENLSYGEGRVLGLPGSYLDRKMFPKGEFLETRPFLSCLQANPNHIGCHTTGESESVFSGTHLLEVELIKLCAEKIFDAEPDSVDGYVASGGTESNIQALWIYRNHYRDVFGAEPKEVCVVYSEDTHYSFVKGCDLLGTSRLPIPVHDATRQLRIDVMRERLVAKREAGAKYFVVVLNMGTTMFGSVDEIGPVVELMDGLGLPYHLHIDAAFGGFVYPFSVPVNELSFAHPRVTSMSLDAHKMLQAPYGTGVFLCRKGYIEHVYTKEATYVPGQDCTLTGSRSGANALAVWMILNHYGDEGGRAFVRGLLDVTDGLCRALDRLKVSYFREPHMNVVAIRAEHVSEELAHRYMLVPDVHGEEPAWWKIVVMDHVDPAVLDAFLAELEASLR